MSTNKVYGDRPNRLPLKELDTRWDYADPAFAHGIPENLPIDQSKHSLFGASKVAADVMVQEYGRYFGLPTCCLRGGCLTGPNHSGVELHGFLSYLVKCNLEGREYKIYGYKGKQVRDNIHAGCGALHVRVLRRRRARARSTISAAARTTPARILEAFALAERFTGKRQRYTYVDQNRDRRPHLLLQRPAQDEGALPALGHHHRASSRRSREIVEAWQTEACIVKILITGTCGFVGSTLIRAWLEGSDREIVGLDNLTRPGARSIGAALKRLGVRVLHGDLRCASRS